MEGGGQSLPPPRYHREPTLVPQGRSNKSQAGSQGQAPTSALLPPVAPKAARCYLVKDLAMGPRSFWVDSHPDKPQKEIPIFHSAELL